MPVPNGLFTGVLQRTEHFDDHYTLATRIPHGDSYWIGGILPLGKMTIYDARVLEKDIFTFLALTEETWWCAVPDQSKLAPTLLELCAGFGGMGIGGMWMGAKVLVAVDKNQLATTHLEANHHGKVLKLDLMELNSAKKIHQACETSPGTATFGFPCQPHSTQGMQKGSQDTRFDVFYGGLRVIFLLQCQSAVLECVPTAGYNQDILAGLKSITEAMRWTCLQTELDLLQQWPSRRRRWWAVLIPATWNTKGLPCWPTSESFTKIGDIMKVWGKWNELDENELQLFPHELVAYMNPELGTEKRLLEMSDHAATILHSYANALTGCPCECRQQPFSEQSLRIGGLRGFFVASQVHGNPRWLHHREAALLLGVPDQVIYCHGPKANLALLGLIASPLQMIWCFSYLKFNAAIATGTHDCPEPTFWLESYKLELLRQTQGLFDQHDSLLRTHFTILDKDGKQLVVASPLATTVSHLLHAERIVLDWNEAGSVTIEGHRLPLSTLLDRHAGPYVLNIEQGIEERTRPHGLLLLALTHEENLEIAFVQPGQFIFEALRTLQLNHINFLVDYNGKLYGADFRVWHSMRLKTLPHGLWPPSFDFGLRGNGLFASALGLHDGHIWYVLNQIIAQLPERQHPLLIHPRIAYALSAKVAIDGAQLRLQAEATDGRICCIFLANDHWAFLWGIVAGEEILWTYFDGLSANLLQQACELAAQLTNQLGFETWSLTYDQIIAQSGDNTCGTIALLHAFHQFGLFGIPSQKAIATLHHHLLQLPLVGILHGRGPSENMDKLIRLLTDHGVPAGVAADRAALVESKLGAAAIRETFLAKNPWAYLKAIANKPSVALRLVHADELTKHTAKQAKDKFGAAIPNHKNKNQKEGHPEECEAHCPGSRHAGVDSIQLH